jgi:hypothetical protein
MPERGYVVVFDLETRNLIQDAAGKRREDKVKALDVSCLCAMKIDSQLVLEGTVESASKAISEADWVTIWPHRSPEFGGSVFESLFEVFDDAEAIGTFNGLGFDHLVIQKYYQGHGGFDRYLRHAFKGVDLFQKLRDTHGKWFKLDAVLEANGLDTKPASGLDAVRWWKEGRYDDIESYCKSDVVQLAKLFLLNELVVPETDGIRAPAALFGLAPAIAAARYRPHDHAAMSSATPESAESADAAEDGDDHDSQQQKRARTVSDVVGSVDVSGPDSDPVSSDF